MKTYPHRALAASLGFATVIASLAAQGSCPARGISLSAAGGRLGDAWSIALAGTPATIGILGLDLAPGPTVTPFGTVCLGITPQLVTSWFLFDPAGNASFGGLIPADPALTGATLFVAAAGIDATQPGGFAFSNGGAIAPRQPRFFVVAAGAASPFGTTPGAFAAVNAVSDDIAFTQALATTVRDAVFVRENGWLVLLLGDGTVLGVDGRTGLQAFRFVLAGAAASASRLAAGANGNLLLLLNTGTPPSPFGGGTPGSVHVLTLPAGNVLPSIPLAAGNPDALLALPGTTVALLRLSDAIVATDYVQGIVQPAITLPGGFGAVADWQLAGNDLYVLLGGRAANPFGGTALPAAICRIDLVTGAVAATQPVAMVAPAVFLRAGPGSTGPSLYAYGSAAGMLEEFAQGTLAPTGAVAVTTGVVGMELSSLGTQWLLLCTGSTCGIPSVLAMQAGTLAVTLGAALPANVQPSLGVSRSAGYGKACAVTSTQAALMRTDPFGLPVFTTPLGLPAGAVRVLSD